MENKKRRTCLIVVIVILVLCCCTVIVLGGGGYYLYSTGRLSVNDVTGLLGIGPAEIQVANLTDTTLTAELTYTDVETGEERHYESLEMGEFDVNTITGVSARAYTLTFSTGSGVPQGGSCYMRVSGGDSWVFVAVPDGIGVVRNGDVVDSNEDVNILTSFLCRGE
ncbi:MAG: hypothetical protein ACK2T7_10330 [Anaerolineales bacterium]